MKLSQARQALRSYESALSQLESIRAKDVQIECLVGISLVYLKLKQKARALGFSHRGVELLGKGMGFVHLQQAYFVHLAEAKEYLWKAYEELMRRARTIRDRELRESFFHRVEMNRAIVEAWQSAHF